MTGLRRQLRDAWAIVRPYWSSEDRWAAWGLLLIVVALTLGIVYINVLLNQWNNTFYNALQDKDYAVFVRQLIRFSWLAGGYILLAIYQLYLTQMLQIRWRRWLTERYLRAWLTDGVYYRMQLVACETDNPDQRIAEDVRLLISGSLDLAIGGLRAVVRNWWGIMRQQKRLTGFTAGYAQAAIIFPFVVAAPRYFRGEIPLGGLVRTATAFGQVQHALSFIVSAYSDIAAWRAVVERFVGFEHAIERVRVQAATKP
jgi:ABC-type uncharacterized transport system fused permease/ATPase subunit